MPPPAGLSTQELLRRAEGFLDKGAYKEALEDYEALLQRPLPQEIEREALYEAGQLALHEGRPKEAASYLSEYLKHNPDAQGKEEAIKKLALALMDLRDYRGAKAWLTRLGPSRDWLVHAYRYNASKGLREPRSEKLSILFERSPWPRMQRTEESLRACYSGSLQTQGLRGSLFWSKKRKTRKPRRPSSMRGFSKRAKKRILRRLRAASAPGEKPAGRRFFLRIFWEGLLFEVFRVPG